MMLLNDQIEIGEVTYKIFGEIGQGTCGHVYVVKSPQGKKFALKVIRQYGRNPIVQDMIDREITTQNKFAGNNFIIQIYANVVRSRAMYILFELGSCSLRNLIGMNTHIQLKQFLEICLDTTKGLHAIHQKGLIHRDIKPENIICVQKTYKITDFGSLQGGTAGDEYVGTTLYMPPQLLNEENYTPKLDVWSLGVTLFQTYFHIHPFFYLTEDSENPLDNKIIKDHLRKNIKYLLPNFTMEKFLTLVQDHTSPERLQKFKNILDATPPQLIEQFTNFFQYKDDRSDIDFFVSAFESLIEPVGDRKGKTSRIKVKKEELPSDIKFYVDTLNMFYQLSFRYGTQKFQTVQFNLQLALWYWNYYNYYGQSYIEYSHYLKLKQEKREKKILWQDIKGILFDYWLQLSTNKDLQFFNELSNLKIRILLCGARYDIYQELEKFIETITNRTGMQIRTLDELQMLLPILQANQLRFIEDTLTNRYYYT